MTKLKPGDWVKCKCCEVKAVFSGVTSNWRYKVLFPDGGADSFSKDNTVKLKRMPIVLAAKMRSDEYFFVMTKKGKFFRLDVGCRHLRAKSVDELKQKAIEFWCDEHGCSDYFTSSGRVALNQESRAIVRSLATRMKRKLAS